MEQGDRRAASWAAQAVGGKWRGSGTGSIVPLKGDASTRRFWRVTLEPRPRRAPGSAIAIDLGPHDLPLYARALDLYPHPLREPPWINIHRFLSSIGAPVPQLYAWSKDERMLLVEDVGTVALCDAARASAGASADLFRDAVKELIRLHHEGTFKRDDACVAFHVAYDERLFGWEMKRFAEHAAGVAVPGADIAALEPELAALAAELGRLPRVFSHRDFHGNNLFVQDEGRLRILDFQDALMAPAAQDLAVLMTTRDTIELVDPALEQRLLDLYYTGMIRHGVRLDREALLRSYWMCVLQHALKCVGLFIALEREGKPGYAGYVPYALGQARRALNNLRAEFPRLRDALRR